MAGGHWDQGSAEVLNQGPERESSPRRTRWSRPAPRVRRLVVAVVIAILAAGAYVRYEITGPRLPAVAVQVTAPPKTAWEPASSGRPSGPVQLHVDLVVRPVGGKGVVTLLGISGPGIAEVRSASLHLSATRPTPASLNAVIDCRKVHLPVATQAYGLRVRVVEGSRRLEGSVDAAGLGPTWASTVDVACGSWLARQSLTLLAATATVDPLKPSADFSLQVVNSGDRAVNLGLTKGYSALDVTAPRVGDLVVPARGRGQVQLHVDVSDCSGIPTPPAVSASGTATTSADDLGLVALVGGRPAGALSPQPVPDGLAPTGIVMSDATATAVADALREVCGNLDGFVTLIDATRSGFDRKRGLFTARIQIDGTPGKVSDLRLVSEEAAAGDGLAFTALWTSVSGLVPDGNGQVEATLQYRAPPQSPCPSDGAYLPGFEIVARVPVAGGVRTVVYSQFVDPSTVPAVMAQLCPA